MKEEQAIEAAKKYIARITNSYPMMPLDDFGNVDFEAYEPGCCPWNILEEFDIYQAEVESGSLDDDVHTIHVFVNWKWSDSEAAEHDVCFEVYVPKDYEPNEFDEFDYERIS